MNFIGSFAAEAVLRFTAAAFEIDPIIKWLGKKIVKILAAADAFLLKNPKECGCG